jgi:hypothetical protein
MATGGEEKAGRHEAGSDGPGTQLEGITSQGHNRLLKVT